MGKAVMLIIPIFLAFALLLFLIVLAVAVISENISIRRHHRTRGIKKKIERKVRKEIFKRLRAKRRIVRERREQENRISGYRRRTCN